MQAAIKYDSVSVDDYLAGEEASRIKHEYIGGVTYAMAGGTQAHNLISLNLATALRNHLQGKPISAIYEGVR